MMGNHKRTWAGRKECTITGQCLEKNLYIYSFKLFYDKKIAGGIAAEPGPPVFVIQPQHLHVQMCQFVHRGFTERDTVPPFYRGKK